MKKNNHHSSGSSEERKVSMTLAYNMSYDREPSLFDTERIARRDDRTRKAMAPVLQQDRDKAKEIVFPLGGGKSISFNLADRRNKPVALTNMGHRVVFGLAFMVQDFKETDIEMASENNRSPRPQRIICLNELSHLLFGRDDQKCRDALITELARLATQWQVWHYVYKEGGKTTERKRVIQLINADFDMGYKEDDREYAIVSFSPAFFYRIKTNHILISRHVFEVWNKKGNQNEMFAEILETLLIFRVWARKAAADARIAMTKKNCPQEEIEEEVRKCLTYEGKVTTLKKMIGTDYSSTRFYKFKFWKDLERVAKGLIDAGIISEMKVSQDKSMVYFLISERETAAVENSQP